jgi:signal transduction histidine kinase
VRRRIRRLALLTAVLALCVFGLPLGVSVYQVDQDEERSELIRVAERAAGTVSPEAFNDRAGIQTVQAEPDTSVGVYTTVGGRVGGRGPASIDQAVAGALTGRLTETVGPRTLVVALPVRDDNQVVGAIRVASSTGSVWQRAFLTWLLMTGLAALAAGLAALLAHRQATRLTRPLTALAGTARALGDGDFTVRAPRSGIPEIDTAATALDDTASRLDTLLTRERSFSEAASHQLRTPLTQVRLLLEAGLVGDPARLRNAAERAVEATDRLEQTIEELLAIARPGPNGHHLLNLSALLEALAQERAPALNAQGRSFHLQIGEVLPVVHTSAAAVRQILGVLVDNATEHGAGPIVIRARCAGNVLALDVLDDGSGLPESTDLFDRAEPKPDGRGRGLPLARALAEADGGRLVITQTAPHTVFTLLLPTD